MMPQANTFRWIAVTEDTLDRMAPAFHFNEQWFQLQVFNFDDNAWETIIEGGFDES